MTVDDQLARRLDQSMADFKQFVAQRFIDQDKRNDDLRAADNRLLDERFKTQTGNIGKAFDASEKVRQEERLTIHNQQTTQDERLKELEDKVGAGTSQESGKRLLKSDLQGYVMMLVVFGGLIANVAIAVWHP